MISFTPCPVTSWAVGICLASLCAFSVLAFSTLFPTAPTTLPHHPRRWCPFLLLSYIELSPILLALAKLSHMPILLPALPVRRFFSANFHIADFARHTPALPLFPAASSPDSRGAAHRAPRFTRHTAIFYISIIQVAFLFSHRVNQRWTPCCVNKAVIMRGLTLKKTAASTINVAIMNLINSPRSRK